MTLAKLRAHLYLRAVKWIAQDPPSLLLIPLAETHDDFHDACLVAWWYCDALRIRDRADFVGAYCAGGEL